MDILHLLFKKLTGKDVLRLENRNKALTGALEIWRASHNNLQLEVQALRDTNVRLKKDMQTELERHLLIKEDYDTISSEMQNTIQALYLQIEVTKKNALPEAKVLPTQQFEGIKILFSEYESKIVNYIKENPGCRQKEIFPAIKVNKGAVSLVLKGLVEKSIILQNVNRGTYNLNEVSSMSF